MNRKCADPLKVTSYIIRLKTPRGGGVQVGPISNGVSVQASTVLTHSPDVIAVLLVGAYLHIPLERHISDIIIFTWTQACYLYQLNIHQGSLSYDFRNWECIIYGIRISLIVIGSITEAKQRRARFIIGWVIAWDCQVLYTLVGLREPRKSDGSSD